MMDSNNSNNYDDNDDDDCNNDDGRTLLDFTTRNKSFTLTLTAAKKLHLALPLANVILGLMTVICKVGETISLSVYTTSLSTHLACNATQVITGPFFVAFFTSFWFPVVFFTWVALVKLCNRNFSLHLTSSHKLLALLGFLNAINRLLIVYSSPSDRTPEFLQPILSSSLIPYTVILRFLVLRKRGSRGRLVCTFAVLVGLIICMEPSIFKLGGKSGSSKDRTATKIYWPILFCSGYIPVALILVILEREMKQDVVVNKSQQGGQSKQEAHALLFQAWIHLYSFLFVVGLFWTAFIPHFGINANWNDFSKNMRWGYQCHFGDGPIYNCTALGTGSGMDTGKDPHCQIPIGRCWIFIVLYCLSNLVSLMLIKYAEGAVFLVIVGVLSVPLATFFNTLFQLDSTTGAFFWGPSVDVDFYYALAGVSIIVPAVIGYNYLGLKESTERTISHLTNSKGCN
jgi:hypothetical protein